MCSAAQLKLMPWQQRRRRWRPTQPLPRDAIGWRHDLPAALPGTNKSPNDLRACKAPPGTQRAAWGRAGGWGGCGGIPRGPCGILSGLGEVVHALPCFLQPRVILVCSGAEHWEHRVANHLFPEEQHDQKIFSRCTGWHGQRAQVTARTCSPGLNKCTASAYRLSQTACPASSRTCDRSDAHRMAGDTTCLCSWIQEVQPGKLATYKSSLDTPSSCWKKGS